MGRNLIIGDIHSRYEKLTAVLEKAGFDPSSDKLYSVGDFCDRGEQPVETLDFLMGLNDSFRPVLGNHDAWLEYWLYRKKFDLDWIAGNGGNITLGKLSSQPAEWLDRLKDWFSRIPLVRFDENNIIIHGGIPDGMDEKALQDIAAMERPVPIFMPESEVIDLIHMDIDMSEYEALEELYWDRSYLLSAMAEGNSTTINLGHGNIRPAREPLNTEKNIWIGHTPLVTSGRPFHSESYHLYAIDTGAGTGKGLLTVVDMDSKEYWQA